MVLLAVWGWFGVVFLVVWGVYMVCCVFCGFCNADFGVLGGFEWCVSAWVYGLGLRVFWVVFICGVGSVYLPCCDCCGGWYNTGFGCVWVVLTACVRFEFVGWIAGVLPVCLSVLLAMWM